MLRSSLCPLGTPEELDGAFDLNPSVCRDLTSRGKAYSTTQSSQQIGTCPNKHLGTKAGAGGGPGLGRRLFMHMKVETNLTDQHCSSTSKNVTCDTTDTETRALGIF